MLSIQFCFFKKILPADIPSAKFNDSTSGKVEELFISASQYDMTNAKKLIPLHISKDDLEWVQVLSEGWASPLRGFMREDEYLQCLHFNCLKTNAGGPIVNQSVAIVLPINDSEKVAIEGMHPPSPTIDIRLGDLNDHRLSLEIDIIIFLFYFQRSFGNLIGV